MSTYLGAMGSLIPIKCASQLTSAGGRDVSFTRTLGRQKAFVGRVSAREWSVDIGLARPGELSGLRLIAEYSSDPLVWYPPDATIGNILDPDIADFAPHTHQAIEGPIVEVEPGVWVKSVFPDDANHPFMQRRDNGIYPAPIPSGRDITFSAWLRGATLSNVQRLRVIWRDSTGANIGVSDADFDVSDEFVRRSGTFTPPTGATSVSLYPYAAQIAGPALALTDTLCGYSSGRGATRIGVHGLCAKCSQVV